MILVTNAFLPSEGDFADLEHIKNLWPVVIAFVSASDRAKFISLSNLASGNLKIETAHRR